MTVTQLNPPIPMMCPKGEGMALVLIDYGPEYDLLWTIAVNDTAEIWTYANKYIRAIKNITLDRVNDDKNFKKCISKKSVYSSLCSFCKGLKNIHVTNTDDQLFLNTTEPCRTCNGKGYIND